jgi:tRNA(Ile)-lysidine synthase
LAPAPETGLAARACARALDILAPSQGPLAVAVSGGSDSTALLLLAHDWATTRRRTLVAATVDHGLRPEAAAEAEAVAALCLRLGIAHTTLRWRPEGAVSQADARTARHRLLALWAKSESASSIAIGHTQDDRIETFLIRARAGSFWHGLAGPAPRSPSPIWPEGDGLRLIRPLLGQPRAALRQTLAALGQGWIEDPSNAAERYERVRMRRIAAALTHESRAAILRSMDRLAVLRAATLAGAREALGGLVEPAAAGFRLEAAGFRRLGSQIRLRLAEALVLAAGGASGPLKSDALARLVQRMEQGLGRATTLAGAKVAERGGWVAFTMAPPRRTAPGLAPEATPSLARAAALLDDPELAALEG